MDKYSYEIIRFIDEKGKANWKEFEKISREYDQQEKELAESVRRFAQIVQFRMREENKQLHEVAEESLKESGIKKLPLEYQELTKFVLGNWWYYLKDFRKWIKDTYGQDLKEYE